jgi:hypothetical protein
VSSSLVVRFTTRLSPLPKVVAPVGDDLTPFTRLVEFDQVTGKGTVWYATREHQRRARCLHDTTEIDSLRDLGTRLLAWIQEGPITNGWPVNLPTCEDAGTCLYARAAAQIGGESDAG